MQKIFSARLDAIHLRARGLSPGHEDDVWSETLGAWDRDEKPETPIRRARQAFRRTFDRRHPVPRVRVRR